MFCNKCHTAPSIKRTRRYISILCNCQITIIYNNNHVKTIKKEEYDATIKTRRL